MNSTLDLIKTCETVVKIGYKFKKGRSTYQIFEYDYYLGFLCQKISGKSDSTCFSLSVTKVIEMLKNQELFI